MPRDVDIIREQIRQGKFDYLKEVDPDHVSAAPDKLILDSASSSEVSKPAHQAHASQMSEDMKPIYPPSVTATATTHNPRSQNGSDGTEFTGHRSSLDRAFGPPVGGKTDKSDQATSPVNPITPTITMEDTDRHTRPSVDRPRPSFDRLRSSMDRTRPSFEASRAFTSAAYLTRVESNLSAKASHAPSSSRAQDISDDLRPEEANR